MTVRRAWWSGGSVVAAVLIPWLPPGLPVLAAAVVAVVVGITNWLAPKADPQ